MGLFRKKKEPIAHPSVERVIHLRSDLHPVEPRLAAYAQIMGAKARTLSFRAETTGGWLRLQPPVEGVHPWETLNLACFLQELGPIILTSAASPTFPAHWLVPSTTLTDLFEGRTESGEAISIEVPSNRVVRVDPDVSQPNRSTNDALAALGVPLDGWSQIDAVLVRSEDPQHGLGPTLEDTVKSRRELRFSGQMI